MDENKPNDTISLVEMLTKLKNLKLSKKEDPKKLGERIAMIQGDYTCKVDKNQKIAVIVNAGRKTTMTRFVRRQCFVKSRVRG